MNSALANLSLCKAAHATAVATAAALREHVQDADRRAVVLALVAAVLRAVKAERGKVVVAVVRKQAAGVRLQSKVVAVVVPMRRLASVAATVKALTLLRAAARLPA
jgi:hypothetical protein